jgi:hypothetical protein
LKVLAGARGSRPDRSGRIYKAVLARGQVPFRQSGHSLQRRENGTPSELRVRQELRALDFKAADSAGRVQAAIEEFREALRAYES